MRIRPVLSILITLCAATLSADTEVRHRFRTTAPAGGITRVIVDIPVAEVRVVNGTHDVIEVSGDVTRDYDSERERRKAQDIVDDSSLEIVRRGKRATVRRKFGPAASSRSARGTGTEFRATISIPAGTAIEVRQTVGEVDLNGSFGDIDVEMRVGEVRVKVPKNSVRELTAGTTIGEVRAHVGDRILTTEGIFAGKTHFLNETGTSDLHVSLNVGEIDVTLTE